MKKSYIFYKTSNPNEKVNNNEPSPYVSIPCILLLPFHLLIIAQSIGLYSDPADRVWLRQSGRRFSVDILSYALFTLYKMTTYLKRRAPVQENNCLNLPQMFN
jgi:hypothetical protein